MTDRSADRDWIEHKYVRTYRIAQKLTRFAADPYRTINEWEDLLGDQSYPSFVRPWQKESLLHAFAKRFAHDLFYDDTSGPYISREEFVDESMSRAVRKRYLPVDLAMGVYGIPWEPFEVPPPDGEMVRDPVMRNVSRWQESNKVADACFDYFGWLSITEAYEKLLGRIAEEVFHIAFQNRMLLARLNLFVANLIADVEVNSIEDPAIARYFARDGRLRRVRIPKWVKRAVFFREHGKCAICGKDLSGLLDALPQEQFDHVVPLADGGLNDVTNIQLLCQKCNNAKSDKEVIASERYRRWFSV
ncbi:HNH endonuclease signature motif containing protein [Nonomuraea sp. NPDC049784]|uniref:HNH endonuclease n=1 Tax=Nonomuraea sp. NPDC049784 TaxID=3154361 RepID=UPI0033EEAE76